jgi:intracellular septation protein
MNLSWIVFFALMGVLNLWVAYTYSTGTWATFKMIAFGMTLVFTVAQVFYVSRYIEEGAPAAGDAGRPADRAE